MRAMILAVSSKDCRNLLNGDLSILVRKKFPKDYVGWVYIYCMKARPYLVRSNGLVDNIAKEYDKNYIPEPKKFELYNFEDEGYSAEFYDFFNSKVVGRFWCDKVEEILFDLAEKEWFTDTLEEKELLKQCCLSQEKLDQYLGNKNGYAIHIAKLEIFDKPKEINEFHKVGYEEAYDLASLSWDIEEGDYHSSMEYLSEKYQLTHAPKTYCYIEI